MPEPVETKSAKVGLSVKPSELRAIEFVFRLHGGDSGQYDGVASVLNDYSVAACVVMHETAKAEAKAEVTA
jgi:hypothetical protein